MNLVVTCRSFDCRGVNHILNYDTGEWIEPLCTKDEDLDFIDPKFTKTLPPELGYLVMECLLDQLLKEGNFASALYYITTSKTIFRKFVDVYFGQHKPFKRQLYQISTVMQHLDQMYDWYFRTHHDPHECEIITTFQTRSHAMYRNLTTLVTPDPWQMNPPQIENWLPFQMDQYRVCKYIQIARTRINACMLATNSHQRHFKGIYRAEHFRFPAIIIRLEKHGENPPMIDDADLIFKSDGWNSFVKLFKKCLGKHSGVYFLVERNVPVHFLNDHTHTFEAVREFETWDSTISREW